MWEQDRFPGDETAFAAVELYRERYYHLYPWEANLRDQIQKRRREQYRVFAHDLVERYDEITLIKPDLAKQARNTKGKQDTNRLVWARIASLYELAMTVTNTAAREGVTVIVPESVEPPYWPMDTVEEEMESELVGV